MRWCLLVSLFVVGCDEVDGVSAAADTAALAPSSGDVAGQPLPPPPVLVMAPLVQGQASDLTVQGVQQGDTVYFFRSTAGPQNNAGPCPAPWNGVCVDLANASYLGSAQGTAGGSATWTLSIPGGAPAGATLWAQAVVDRGGNVSETGSTSQVIMAQVLDSDGDGYTDAEEGAPQTDTDGDGIADYLDDDSDNDTLPDRDELDRDSDGDGAHDRVDDDDDNDGIPTMLEDTDGSGTVLDDDADGDGIPDYLDVGVDADGDGYPVPLDCNDADSTVNPGAVEIPNDGRDSNCNGSDNQ